MYRYSYAHVGYAALVATVSLVVALRGPFSAVSAVVSTVAVVCAATPAIVLSGAVAGTVLLGLLLAASAFFTCIALGSIARYGVVLKTYGRRWAEWAVAAAIAVCALAALEGALYAPPVSEAEAIAAAALLLCNASDPSVAAVAAGEPLRAAAQRWAWLFAKAAALGGVSALVLLVVKLVVVRAAILPASLPSLLHRWVFPEGRNEMIEQSRVGALAESDSSDDAAPGWVELDVTSADGLRVDSMVYTPPVNNEDARWVMWFLGNGGDFGELLIMLKGYAETLGVGLICFNFRGIGRSEGVPLRDADLVEDARAVFDAAAARFGCTPHTVLFRGHSLGGAVATMLRASTPAHAAGPLLNDRSFSTLAAVPISLVKMKRDDMPAFLAKALLAFFPWALHLIGWSMDAQSAWEKVEGKKLLAWHRKDEIINYEHASLYCALKRAAVARDPALLLDGSSNDPDDDPTLCVAAEARPRCLRLRGGTESPHNFVSDPRTRTEEMAWAREALGLTSSSGRRSAPRATPAAQVAAEMAAVQDEVVDQVSNHLIGVCDGDVGVALDKARAVVRLLHMRAAQQQRARNS